MHSSGCLSGRPLISRSGHLWYQDAICIRTWTEAADFKLTPAPLVSRQETHMMDTEGHVAQVVGQQRGQVLSGSTVRQQRGQVLSGSTVRQRRGAGTVRQQRGGRYCQATEGAGTRDDMHAHHIPHITLPQLYCQAHSRGYTDLA